MEAFWNDIKSHFYDIGFNIIEAVLVIFVGWKLINILIKFLIGRKFMEKLDKGVQTFLKSFTVILLRALLFLTAAAILGIPTTNIMALLTSAGLAIGLALQGGLSNLVGGLTLLISKPFVVGDYIDANGKSGTVQSISIFYTTILTIDNCRIVIPNGTLANSVVSNYSAEPRRRVDIDFSVDYESDLDTVYSCLRHVAEKSEYALNDPEPFTGLKEHGDSALVVTLRVWAETEHYWDLYFYLKDAVKREFDEHGIVIPFPQMDIHTK